jgi:small subunit ribosomal protein S6
MRCGATSPREEDIVLRKYELLFITHPEYDDEKIAAVISRYQDVITNGKGAVTSAEKWGKRRLAYEINDLREGTYVLVIFEAEREVAAELDRLMKIDQEILRHMISRLDNVKHKQRTPRQPQRKPVEPRIESAAAPAVRVVKEAPAETAPEGAGQEEPSEGEPVEPK